MKIRVRFNKSRGQPGRGTVDHAWRVFVGEREYIAKHVAINVPCWGEKEADSDDWNIACEGKLEIDRKNSSVSIDPVL